jgi:hypothetical protein
MNHPALAAYKQLLKDGKKSFRSTDTAEAIDAIAAETEMFLSSLSVVPLPSKRTDKKYVAFESDGKISGPVNEALFDSKWATWNQLRTEMASGKLTMSPEEITQAVYTAAIGFCAVADLLGTRSQKVRGTYFEYLIAFFFSWQAGVDPTRATPLLSLKEKGSNLPTDLTFDLGEDRPKFHVPVKTSTRERAIMLWAHQKLLDGAYGIERFLGLPVLLAETKTERSSREVIEICTPQQWRIYQTYIARLACIYYLDAPTVYLGLNECFPKLPVRPFGAFFYDWPELTS